jgi:hypothetical protein
LICSFVIAEADENNAPEVLGVVPSLVNGKGTITIAYKDADGASTLDSVRLVIGEKKNNHKFIISHSVSKNTTKIRTDDSEAIVSVFGKKKLDDDYVSINLGGITHSFNNRLGWVVIPVAFDEEAILDGPGYEEYMVRVQLKDAGSKETELVPGSVISFEHGTPLRGITENYWSGKFKWLGYGGNEVELEINWSHVPTQWWLADNVLYFAFDLEQFAIKNYDFNKVYYLKIFQYDYVTETLTIGPRNDYFDLGRVSVSTYKSGDMYHHTFYFKLRRKKAMWSWSSDVKDMWFYCLRKYSNTSYMGSTVSFRIWKIPTFWMKIKDFFESERENFFWFTP